MKTTIRDLKSGRSIGRFVRVVALGFALAVTGGSAFAQGPGSGYGYGPMMGPGMSGWGWGLMGGLHGLFWLVLLALAGVALVALVRYLWRGGGGTDVTSSSARRVLDERYAKGEIDRAEYLQRRQDLG
jgi:putative membrane protein